MAAQHSRYGDYSTRYRFNGKEQDEDTGFYYYGARYYTPSLSRWLSIDPLAEKYQGMSPYAYVANNPIMYIDPDGQRIVLGFETDTDGNRVGEQDVKNNINRGLGDVNENFAQIGEDGSLSINITDEQRANLTEEQSSFLGTLEEGINLTDSDGVSLDVNIDIVSGSENVFVGNFADSAIDIADVNAFGNNEVRNENDVLQFELSEQIDKTKNNVSHKSAHGKAKSLLSNKKGNLRMREPQIQRNRDGSPKLRNGRPVIKKRTTATFSDNKTGTISTIQFKTKNNNIKSVQWKKL